MQYVIHTSRNQKVGDHFYSWIFDNFKIDNFTLDIDSSVMTRYGQQEDATKGYNPNKRMRLSHHPLIAFVNDVKLVANIWLRSDDSSSVNNFLSFSDDTLSKLKNKTVSLIHSAALIFAKIAYNLISQFRTFVLQEKT
jgi:hypothetical protein